MYALINPSTPGLVKVGMTSRDPSDRVSELSSATGVATPFILVYKEHFEDCHDAEQHIHTLLERQGVRVAANREFFQGEVSEIIKAIALAPGKSEPGTSVQFDDDDDLLSSAPDELDEFVLEGYKPKTPDQEVYEEAERYYYGFGDTLQDYGEAFQLYKQAARLGSGDAYHMIGRMYMDGEGVRQDYGKALEYFKEAARREVFCAYGRMADIFRETSHPENENKAWKKYFEELGKNPNKKFESDHNPIIVQNFLFWRTTRPSFMSAAKVKLSNEEEKYVGAMRPIKGQIVEFCQLGYERAVENFGETNDHSKMQKAVMSWAASI
ncbi:GIY-YIG nuclease family protein [Methylorubrum extorquens]|uniref:GIY-YIG nuclease family protein n=1 Tax=Methylorubrum extorquens TaxID=408 RepID=UPI00167F3B78|nr:GIY-YIG nuclease family protein [Methylorubrum extorquens]WIU40072.1 GIY-YIG nuclease family protein [Methylorubrum extorquens]